jgi:hypothetical protein
LSIEGIMKLSKTPDAPIACVSEKFWDPFNRYGDFLGFPNAHVLLLDLGGALLPSKMQVIDLEMALATDGRRFYNCVFESTNPTLVHSHGWWTRFLRSDFDPRIARDYTLVYRPNELENDSRLRVSRRAKRVAVRFTP